MKISKKALFAVITIIMLFSAAFTFARGSGEGKALKVGTLMALTGDLREYGPPIQSGAVLAAKQLTDAGFPIKLSHGDSETNEIAGVDAANKLVNIDGVVAIVGPLGSGVTKAVAESVTSPTGVILISPSSTSPILTDLPADKDRDFLFRTCPSDDLQGIVAGKVAKEKYNTISVLFVNNSYGQGLAESFKRSFEQAGGKILAMVPLEQGAETYTAELKQALADTPDALAAFTYPESAIVYLREAIEFYNYKNFFFCDGTKSEKIIQAIGADNLEGMIGTAPGSTGGASLEMFNAAYKEEFGSVPPLPFITNAYDAVAVIGLAAYKASVEGKELNPANIRDNLLAIAGGAGEIIRPGEFEKAFGLIKEGKDINYEGSAGAVDFDAKGDVVTPFDIWAYSGGTIKVLRTE